MFFKQLFGAQQNIIKIDRSGVFECPLVAAISHRGQMLFVGLGQGGCSGGPNAARLPTADLVQQIARAQGLAADADFAQHRASQALLVAAVVDGKPLGIAEPTNVSPQDLQAVRMERGDLRPRLLALAKQLLHPLLHLIGRFVGERHGQNAIGGRAVANQLGNAKRHHARLARPGTGQDQQGAGQVWKRLFVEQDSSGSTWPEMVPGIAGQKRGMRWPLPQADFDGSSPTPPECFLWCGGCVFPVSRVPGWAHEALCGRRHEMGAHSVGPCSAAGNQPLLLTVFLNQFYT